MDTGLPLTGGARSHSWGGVELFAASTPADGVIRRSARPLPRLQLAQLAGRPAVQIIFARVAKLGVQAPAGDSTDILIVPLSLCAARQVLVVVSYIGRLPCLRAGADIMR